MQILTEAQLEQDCRVKAKGYDCILLKIQANKGWPDRMLLIPGGECMFMEFKKDRMPLRPLQREVIEQLRRMGFKAGVIRSKEEFQVCLLLMLSQPLNGNQDHIKNAVLTGY